MEHEKVQEGDYEQQLLYRAQQRELIGLVAGWVAHDLDHLLTETLVQMLMAVVKLSVHSPAGSHLIKACKLTEQANTLTCQFLTRTQCEAFRPEPQNLNQLVRENGHKMTAWPFKKVDVQYDLAPELPAVLGDQHQLCQVIVNLLVNATESIEGDRGTVQICTCEKTVASPADFAGAATPPPGRYVCLIVTDFGAGMDEESLARIFDPYFSARPERCGLGLFNLLRIVKRHGGGVQVTSRPGKGTTFSIYLPVSSPAAKGATHPLDPKEVYEEN